MKVIKVMIECIAAMLCYAFIGQRCEISVASSCEQ